MTVKAPACIKILYCKSVRNYGLPHHYRDQYLVTGFNIYHVISIPWKPLVCAIMESSVMFETLNLPFVNYFPSSN